MNVDKIKENIGEIKISIWYNKILMKTFNSFEIKVFTLYRGGGMTNNQKNK